MTEHSAHVDAVLDDLIDVVPAVEKLTQDARQLSSGEGTAGTGAAIA